MGIIKVGNENRQLMDIGDRVIVRDNIFDNTYTGIITEIEYCYFRFQLEDGSTMTYQWNCGINVEIISD